MNKVKTEVVHLSKLMTQM